MTEQQIDVWTIDLRVPDADVARLSEMLSFYERARAARLTGEHARRAIAGRAALRTVLGRYIDVAPAEIGYDFGPHGKPRHGLRKTKSSGPRDIAIGSRIFDRIC